MPCAELGDRLARAAGAFSRPQAARQDLDVSMRDDVEGVTEPALARDFAVLVLVKISEIRVCEGGVGPLNRREFGWVELAVAIGVPDRRFVLEQAVLLRPGVDWAKVEGPLISSGRWR